MKTIQTPDTGIFRIKKKLGQNFLTDTNILDKIMDAGKIDDNTYVIEIGPGTGALTEKLVKKAKKVLAYEIDPELIPILRTRFAETKNLVLVNRDILKIDIDQDISRYFDKDAKAVVMSNLPYYITTPILMKVLETAMRVDRLVLMTQLEVARRLTSEPNTKDYNALSVIIAYRSRARFLFKVPRTVFVPRPNVDSAVISIEVRHVRENAPRNEDCFFHLVRNSFRQRRKTLVNNLLGAYPSLDRPGLEKMLEEANIDKNARAEALQLDDFLELAEVFCETGMNT